MVSAEVVNLRLARKRAKRKADEKVAEQNRLAHGRTAIERATIRYESETRDRHLDDSFRGRPGERDSTT